MFKYLVLSRAPYVMHQVAQLHAPQRHRPVARSGGDRASVARIHSHTGTGAAATTRAGTRAATGATATAAVRATAATPTPHPHDPLRHHIIPRDRKIPMQLLVPFQRRFDIHPPVFFTPTASFGNGVSESHAQGGEFCALVGAVVVHPTTDLAGDLAHTGEVRWGSRVQGEARRVR